MIVRLAALRCGHRHFVDYIILGDDVAIADFKVAEEYKKIILSLGIDISLSKSVLPMKGYNS